MASSPTWTHSPVAFFPLAAVSCMGPGETRHKSLHLGDRSRWRLWGKGKKPGYVWQSRERSLVRKMFLFKLRGMLNAWELVLKETQTFLLPADLGL